jgi:hypothetical protein
MQNLKIDVTPSGHRKQQASQVEVGISKVENRGTQAGNLGEGKFRQKIKWNRK